MLTKEEEKQLHAEMSAHQTELEEKWNAAKKELDGLIHPKYFDFAENHDTFYSNGIVETHEVDDKQNGYGKDQRNCRIKGENSPLYMHTTSEVEYYYGYEGKYEGDSVEYWVHQWSVGMEGDSYSGYLLFPMTDGRFWKVRYSC